MGVRQVMETKTLTIQWNNEQLPVLPVDPGAYLTFSIHNSGNALELTGNRAGLGPDGQVSKADIPEHTEYNTESLAKFAFSMFWRAMRFAEEQQVPILLDY